MSGRTRDHPRYVPRFEVTIGDRNLSEPGGELADLVVETTLSGADRFQCTLAHRFDERRGTFEALSWEAFSVGTDVRIEAGYATEGSFTTLFVGRIDSITTEFAPRMGPTVQIAGYGLLRETMRGTRSDSWSETTIGTVVENVLSDYGFTTIDVEDADRQRRRLLQHAQSDFRFLDDLASTYGLSFHARRETVRFVPPASIEDGHAPDATLSYGDELASFKVERSPAPTDVQVRTWSPQEVTAENVTATAGDGNGKAADTRASGQRSHDEVFTVPEMPRGEAERIASSKAEEAAGDAVTGQGRADGNPAIQAGATVEIEGVGDRFSGAYCVTSATHRLGGDGYWTTFEARTVSG